MSRRGSADGPTGLVVVDKDPGWTSHDVVARLRRLYGQRRTGHAGTLDPSATGVLLVGLGRATRLLRFLQDTTKGYEGELTLGSTTTSLDADGEVTARFDMTGVGPDEVAGAASALTGDLLQVPPMVSAIKIDGQRLHALARQGIEVERPARPVRVDTFAVVPTLDPLRYRFSVVCSSGTYVRSLVDDLGRALGGGAHMSLLRRTAVGAFGLADARTIDELTVVLGEGAGSGGIDETLLTPAQALRHLEQVEVDGEAVDRIRRGMALDRGGLPTSGLGPFALIDGDGVLLAVYDGTEPDRLVPAVVLASP